MEPEKILMGVKPSTIDETVRSICKTLVGKDLSFRQAECLLEMAKESLKDAKI